MNKLLRIFLALSVFFTVAAANAQNEPVDERASTRTKKMTQELSLNDAQIKQVQVLNTETITEMDKVKANGNNPEEKRKLKANYDEKLKTILTQDQMSKYIANQRNQKK